MRIYYTFMPSPLALVACYSSSIRPFAPRLDTFPEKPTIYVSLEVLTTMSMTSYQVIKKAIHFDSPDRLPLIFDSLGISDIRELFSSDIEHVRRRVRR